MTRDDLDLAFIREFQCGGAQIMGVSTLERQDRVRVAIYRAKLQDSRFHDQPYSYAEAFRLWAGKPLEQRAKPRPNVDDFAPDDREIESDE